MSRARGDSGIDGFLNLAKPSGPTSHDQVAAVRRLFGTSRVGHAGTLDPLASGVLPVALGRATRLLNRLAAATKSYRAEAEFGLRTTTDDLEGRVLERCASPPLDVEEIQSALRRFVGRQLQRPPAYSAARQAGQRAYQLARAGEAVDLAPRWIEISRAELISWSPPRLVFEVECSKGTYVRALVRDLAEHLGTLACLAGLARLRVGDFHLEDSVSLADLANRPPEGRLAALQSPDVVLRNLPTVVLDEFALDHFRHGRGWSQAASGAEGRAYDSAGNFVGLLVADPASGQWRARLLFLD